MKDSTFDFFQIPYVWGGSDFSGCDCYGLVYLWYKHRLNIELFDYKRPKNIASADSEYVKGFSLNQFYEVFSVEENDVLIMKDGYGGYNHLGIFTKNKVLQTREATGVTITRFCFSFKKIEGIFRYKNESKTN